MKNIQTILNVVFGIAIIGLGVLHFMDSRTSTSGPIKFEKRALNDTSHSGGKTPLVYFNIDSLTKNYLLYQDEKAKVESTGKGAEQQLLAKQKSFESQAVAFQKEMQDFQQRAQYLTITEREAREKALVVKQQQLQKMEQEFEVLRQSLASSSMKIGADAEKKVYDKVSSFLKTYSQENGYEYVIGQTTGSGIWYADSTYDITTDLVNKLNEAYTKEKGN